MKLNQAYDLVKQPRYVEACKVIAEAEAEETRKAEAEDELGAEDKLETD